jgi:hypothetical protein
MLNNESPVRTVADRITKDEDIQVSQHSSKPNVVGSLVLRDENNLLSEWFLK